MDWSTVMGTVASSVAAEIVFHPLDTLLTLHQTTPGAGFILPWRRYWNGLVPSMTMSVPAFTVDVVGYRECKKLLAPYLGAGSVSNYITSAAIAQGCASLLWTPLEVIKGRMQLSHNTPMRTVVKQIYKTEGFKGYYRGYWVGLGIYLPYTVLFWVLYEETRNWLSGAAENPQVQPTLAQTAIAASVSTAVGETLTNFLAVVKKRTQLATSDELKSLRPNDSQSLLQVARNLVKEQGLTRALTRGLTVRLLGSVPGAALTMALLELLCPDPTR